MFNNPFESFHNTVAEAKDEREQLDQLLTISTPRERLLLSLIVVSVLALGSWLVFGVVAHTVSVQGVVLKRASDLNDGVLAVSMVHQDDTTKVNEIGSGMPATAKIQLDLGRNQIVRGSVRDVTIGALAPVLDSPSVESISASWVEITLESELDSDLIVGRQCTVIIEIGHRSPLSVFASTLFQNG